MKCARTVVSEENFARIGRCLKHRRVGDEKSKALVRVYYRDNGKLSESTSGNPAGRPAGDEDSSSMRIFVM